MSIESLLFQNKKFRIAFVVLFLVLLNVTLGFVYLHISKSAEATSQTTSQYPELTAVDMTQMNFDEVSSYIKKIAEAKGAVYAFDILKRAQLPTRIDTHLVAHTIGDILFKQKGAQGIQYCTDDFRNACSHSIVIGLFLKKGEKALDDLAPLCEKAPGGKGAYGMCFHGLGHGVLAYSDYDMHNAVRLCEKLSPGENKIESRECIGGTMMEMVSGIHDRQTWQKQNINYFTDDPLSPCDADFIPSYARPVCYTYLTPHFFIREGGVIGQPTPDIYQKAFTYCNQIPTSDPADRFACFGGFGKEFVVTARNRDVRNIAAITNEEIAHVYTWCHLAGTAEGENACLFTAVGSLYWGGENDRTGAIRFCNIAAEGGSRNACFLHLTALVNYYIDDVVYRKAYCEEVPPELKNRCQKQLFRT